MATASEDLAAAAQLLEYAGKRLILNIDANVVKAGSLILSASNHMKTAANTMLTEPMGYDGTPV